MMDMCCRISSELNRLLGRIFFISPLMLVFDNNIYFRKAVVRCVLLSFGGNMASISCNRTVFGFLVFGLLA